MRRRRSGSQRLFSGRRGPKKTKTILLLLQSLSKHSKLPVCLRAHRNLRFQLAQEPEEEGKVDVYSEAFVGPHDTCEAVDNKV